MTSCVSPYSMDWQLSPRVVAQQSRECECNRPKPCPSSWATIRRFMLSFIHALDGFPPTNAAPPHGQAFRGKAYTRRLYADMLTPTAVAACMAKFSIFVSSHTVLS